MVFWRAVVERFPGAEVAPAEVGGLYIDIGSLLHDGIVDRNRGGRGESLVDKLAFLRGGVAELSCIENGGRFRGIFLERVQDRIGAPEEHSGVPEEFSGGEEHLGHLLVGFFGKRLHLHDFREAVDGGTLLDVAVACMGRRWLEADGEQAVALLHKLKPFAQSLMEGILAQDQMVGGKGHDRSLRVEGVDVVGSPADAGGCVAAGGLEKDVALLHVGELLADNVIICGVGDEDDIVGVRHRLDAVDSELEQRAPRAEEVEKLFGHAAAAKGPETGAYAAAHNHAISVFSLRIVGFHNLLK